MKIFHLVLEDLEIPRHFRGLRELAWVCDEWHGIIHTTPSLWALVSTNFSPTLLQAALDKSRHALLKVTHLQTSSNDEPRFANLLKVAQHVHRWQEASLTLPNIERVRHYLQLPAPLITHMDITAIHPDHSIDLFGGQAESLKSLRLCRVPISFDTPVLSNLWHLELQELYHSPTTADLLRALDACPHLVRLSLKHIRADAVPLPEDHPVVVLPNLKELRIAQLPFAYSSIILCAIQIPECSELGLECDLLEMPEAQEPPEMESEPLPSVPYLNDTLGHLIDPLKRSILSASTISVSLATGRLLISHSLSDEASPLNIHLTNITSCCAFKWLVDTFAAELCHDRLSLSVSLLNGFNAARVDFLDTLVLLERVHDITIAAGTDGVDTLFDHLGRPFTQNGVMRWPLPRWRVLTVQNNQIYRLLPLVQRRYGRDGSGAMTIDGVPMQLREDLPLPFQRITVAIDDPTVVQPLKVIVGHNVVYSPPPRLPAPYFSFQPSEHPHFGAPHIQTPIYTPTTLHFGTQAVHTPPPNWQAQDDWQHWETPELDAQPDEEA